MVKIKIVTIVNQPIADELLKFQRRSKTNELKFDGPAAQTRIDSIQ